MEVLAAVQQQLLGSKYDAMVRKSVQNIPQAVEWLRADHDMLARKLSERSEIDQMVAELAWERVTDQHDIYSGRDGHGIGSAAACSHRECVAALLAMQATHGEFKSR